MVPDDDDTDNYVYELDLEMPYGTFTSEILVRPK